MCYFIVTFIRDKDKGYDPRNMSRMKLKNLESIKIKNRHNTQERIENQYYVLISIAGIEVPVCLIV